MAAIRADRPPGLEPIFPAHPSLAFPPDGAASGSALPAAIGPIEAGTPEGVQATERAVLLRAADEVQELPAPASGAAATKDTTGVFLTPQSLVTFPVASAVLLVVWKVLMVVFPESGAHLSSFRSSAHSCWAHSFTKLACPRTLRAVSNSFWLASQY